MAGHQPHPRFSAPLEPLAGPLRASATLATLRPSATGPLRTLGMLRPSAADPHRSKPQERSPIGVGRLKCPANKTMIKYIK
jgi:hypothetical protein